MKINKENKYSLLTATKAFGMGVNKGNVAYTVHFGIPGSMESLYQEAGMWLTRLYFPFMEKHSTITIIATS